MILNVIRDLLDHHEFERESLFPKVVQNLYVISSEDNFYVLTEVFVHLISCI